MNLENNIQNSTFINEHLLNIYEHIMLSFFDSSIKKDDAYKVLNDLDQRVKKNKCDLEDIHRSMQQALECFRKINDLKINLLIDLERLTKKQL
ncbi:MAG TPA: hypothetical protein DCG75_03620 [Bacteroidales bacterium]|nr:hypothetical protein [Bacteroidales bacterium]